MPYQWHRLYENGDTVILPDHMKIIRELSNIHNLAINKTLKNSNPQQQQQHNPRYGPVGSKYTTSAGEKAQVIF